MSLPKNIKVSRQNAGSYYYWRAENPERKVAVFSREGSPEYGDPAVMWVAAAEWRSDTYSDPVTTKREAVKAAITFLTESWANSDIKD